MEKNKSTTKSISEIMEMIDYSLDKTRKLKNISKAVLVLGSITHDYTRGTLAKALSEQIDDAAWGVELAGRYIDDLEAALDKEIPTIDEDTTEDDLPFVTPEEKEDE